MGEAGIVMEEVEERDDDEMKVPFAFSKCLSVKKKGVSTYVAECNICGKQVVTSPHKMMYGHYLQKPKQNMGVQCITPSLLERNHPQFHAELKRRWDALQEKKRVTIEDLESLVANKKRKALNEAAGASISSGCKTVDDETSSGNTSPSTSGGVRFPAQHALKTDERPYAFLPALEKQKRRDECQTAWDRAFAMCGIKYQTADNPAFREALQKTRACPDFKIACRQTMAWTGAGRQPYAHISSGVYECTGGGGGQRGLQSRARLQPCGVQWAP